MKRLLAALVLVGCSFDVEKEGTNPGECTDGIDNDGNDLADCLDPACPCGADSDADTDSDSDTGTGTEPPDCTDTYGDAPGYVLCSADDDSCRFAANTRNRNCAELCQAHAGTCLSVHEPGGSECADGTEAFCNASTADRLICECTR